jgi:hypothetical protein
MRIFLHLMLSFFLAFLGLLACPLAASVGISQILSVWLFPAKFIVPGISAVVPAAWIYRSPNDENYWPQVSAGGFAILCSLVFWALLFFLLLELRHHFKQESKLG